MARKSEKWTGKITAKTKKKRTGKTGMMIMWFLAIGLLGGIFFLVCVERKELSNQKDRENVEYVICEDSHLPEQLKKLLKEKEKKPGTFTYRNSLYLYLVVCYGEKPYSGYSIKVEDCHRTKDVLYLRTQLLGPAKGESITKTPTCPRLVLRCRKIKALCIIDS